MSTQATLPAVPNEKPHVPGAALKRPPARAWRSAPSPLPFRSAAQHPEDAQHRDAELFYLQKQIQAQTPMVIVLEDSEVVEGCIEWYDRNSLKIRGQAKTLIYKSAIKYMHKLGDHGR